jgi:hypothetical protein
MYDMMSSRQMAVLARYVSVGFNEIKRGTFLPEAFSGPLNLSTLKADFGAANEPPELFDKLRTVRSNHSQSHIEIGSK